MSNNIKADLAPHLLNARVLIEGDEGWEEALERWTRYRTEFPAAVVKPTNEHDVVATVSYSVKNGRPFVVKGGGHSNGFSSICSPGIVVDLSKMRRTTIDVEKQVLVADGGATMGDGVRSAGSAAMAITTGTCNEVGLVSAALGGGIGRFLGHWGYAADTVLSMRVVVVDQTGTARVVEASPDVNSDLFWGLRGSGHSFGVVVQATFRAREWQHETWHSCLVFSPENVGLVAEAVERMHYQRGMQGRLVFCAPANQPLVLLQMWYMGNPEDAPSKFQDLLRLPSMRDHPLNSVGRRIPYMRLNDSSDRICQYAGRKNLAAFGMRTMSAPSCTAALNEYTRFIHEQPDAIRTHILVEFYSVDAVRDLDPRGEETSVPSELRRDVKYWVMPLAWYEDPGLDQLCEDLNRSIREKFLSQPDGERAGSIGYVNMPFGDDNAISLFGEGQRLARLQALKAKWDPLGVIRGIVGHSMKSE
ncbi:FAD binding domain protein [Aspergillus sp. HF37]|nr:FAD binding domain protein [Aspergillus sp. HF37]